MLAQDTTSPEGEAEFGRQLVIFILIWLGITIAVAILLILLSPWLTNVF